MSKKLAFRFDIDTHKCIRDGVPSLLDIAEDMDVPFTFFLNAGKSVSVKETLLHAMSTGRSKNKENHTMSAAPIQMMSARQKLGNFDYIYAAIMNPCICSYKNNLKRMYRSKCEVGLHGGRNHAIWQSQAMEWSKKTVREEINWAISEVRKTLDGFAPEGFASPGWTKPDGLEEVLKDMGFYYSADFRQMGGRIDLEAQEIPVVGVNLCGEPGGVAFFENCRVRDLSTDDIVKQVLGTVEEQDVAVLYDHPYYAGIKETHTIRRIITEAKNNGIEIVAVRDLV